MSLDISSILAGLDNWQADQERRRVRGLVRAAHGVQQDMQATVAHGNVTGATRASYRAYVVGEGAPDESPTVASGLAAVTALNPGAQAVGDWQIGPHETGVALTAFTNYLTKLQVEYAGSKAVLLPTLLANMDNLTEAAAEGQ